jgi:hypothetical protein
LPVARRQRLGALGDAAEQVFQPVGIGLGEVVQDIGRDRVLVAGVADAKADAGVGVAEMAVDRPQPVVSGMAAALFQAQFAGGEVKFVMKDGEVGQRQFPEGDSASPGPTGRRGS